MAVVELYSQRRKRELGLADDDVLQYDSLPARLRKQITLIIEDIYGDEDSYGFNDSYTVIVKALRREHGLSALISNPMQRYQYELFHCIQFTIDHDLLLDAIDLSFRTIFNRMVAAADNADHAIERDCRAAIEEANERFKLSGCGYAFDAGRLMRVDSQFLHADAVKPALVVISSAAFESANKEFREAHEHWRAGRFPAVLIDCLKAFESTMKIIADEREWELPVKGKLTAAVLVKACWDNELIPKYYEAHMNGLRGVLEGGIPTPRNMQAGHGAGAGRAEPIPEELVKYVLHLTAATILFLVDAHKARP